MRRGRSKTENCTSAHCLGPGFCSWNRAAAPFPSDLARASLKSAMKWSVKATWLARSPTKSNTASRGAEMTVSTVTGPMGADCMAARALGGARSDRQVPLGGVHALGLGVLPLGGGNLAEA